MEVEIKSEALTREQLVILQEEFNLCEELRNPSPELRAAIAKLCEDAAFRFIAGINAPAFTTITDPT